LQPSTTLSRRSTVALKRIPERRATSGALKHSICGFPAGLRRAPAAAHVERWTSALIKYEAVAMRRH
jgi:hypothetical protein